jgi:TrpR-related protein YerC/YecD
MSKNTWDNPNINNLFKAILKLQSPTEAKRFFRDLLTPKELIEFSNRWQTAQMLDQKTDYLTIAKTTGLSSTTIARISLWLNKGMGGYRLMLKRINHHSHPFPKIRLKKA